MEIDIHTIPDVLIKLKGVERLDRVLLDMLNGVISAPANIKSVLKDMYEETLLLNKDTITVFLKTEESVSCMENLEVEGRNRSNELLVEMIFKSFNLPDAITVSNLLCRS